MFGISPAFWGSNPLTGWPVWDNTLDTNALSNSLDIYNITADLVQPMTNNSCVAVVGGVCNVSGIYKDAIRLVRVTRSPTNSHTFAWGALYPRTSTDEGWDGNAICALSTTKVLSVTCATAGNSYVTLYNVDTTALSAIIATETLFDTTRVGQASMVKISTTQALLTFLNYTDNTLYAVKITVTGNTITVSNKLTVLTPSDGPWQFDSVYVPSANKAYVTATKTGVINQIKVIPIDCTGATPVADVTNTATMGTNAGLYYVSADTNINGQIIMMYGSITSHTLNAVLINLVYNPATGISDIPQIVSTFLVAGTGGAYFYNGVSMIDDQHALVTFKNPVYGYKLTTRVLSYTNNQLKAGSTTPVVVWTSPYNPSAATGWDYKSGPIDVLRLSDNELLVFHQDYTWSLEAKVLWNGINSYV